jgi:hypothetical protein
MLSIQQIASEQKTFPAYRRQVRNDARKTDIASLPASRQALSAKRSIQRLPSMKLLRSASLLYQ